MADLIELGLLRELTVFDGARFNWGRRNAPILAYDKRGRLHIVYPTGYVIGVATAKQQARYRTTHWGIAGDGQVLEADFARTGPFKSLGIGRTIVYETRKGFDRDPVEYEHEWGEGARGTWRAPSIEEHVCTGCRCAMRGALRLRGGTYRVTERGIVG